MKDRLLKTAGNLLRHIRPTGEGIPLPYVGGLNTIDSPFGQIRKNASTESGKLLDSLNLWCQNNFQSCELVIVADEFEAIVAIESIRKLPFPKLQIEYIDRLAQMSYDGITSDHIAHFFDLDGQVLTPSQLTNIVDYRQVAQEIAAFLSGQKRSHGVHNAIHVHYEMLAEKLKKMQEIREESTSAAVNPNE